MTILSDKTIAELIDKSQLVRGGTSSSARHCAYEFKAGRVVYGGIDAQTHQIRSIDLIAQPNTTATIKPSAVVWVRSKEQVKIPADMVGMWIQTNSLSRGGLLLLNSTLVEPGYEGHLSAHFVNLGASPVTLSSSTTIAKLVFVKLDQPAEALVDSSKFTSYDVLVDGLASQSNPSFLRIGELVPDLRSATESSVSEARRLVDAAAVESRKQIEAVAAESLTQAREELESMRKETFIKAGGAFAAGLVLAVAFALYAFPKLRELDNESKARISAVVAEQNAALLGQLTQLQKDISEIKENSKESISVQAPSSNKTPAP